MRLPGLSVLPVLAILLIFLSLGLHCGQSTEERRLSVYELGADPTPENIQKLRDLWTDPDGQVRATALNKLVGLDVPDAEALCVESLADADDFVRSIAAKLIGDLGNAAHADLLVARLMEDPFPRARENAAVSLGILGGDAAVAGLIQGLDDPLTKVRLAAAKGLRITDPVAGIAALSRVLLEDPAWEVRVQAAGALGLTADADVLPVLEAAKEDENASVRSAVDNAILTLEVP
jgi:HEAT repeat protein